MPQTLSHPRSLAAGHRRRARGGDLVPTLALQLLRVTVDRGIAKRSDTRFRSPSPAASHSQGADPDQRGQSYRGAHDGGRAAPGLRLAAIPLLTCQAPEGLEPLSPSKPRRPVWKILTTTCRCGSTGRERPKGSPFPEQISEIMVFGRKDAYLGAQNTTKEGCQRPPSGRKEPESEAGVSSEHFAL